MSLRPVTASSAPVNVDALRRRPASTSLRWAISLAAALALHAGAAWLLLRQAIPVQPDPPIEAITLDLTPAPPPPPVPPPQPVEPLPPEPVPPPAAVMPPAPIPLPPKPKPHRLPIPKQIPPKQDLPKVLPQPAAQEAPAREAPAREASAPTAPPAPVAAAALAPAASSAVSASWKSQILDRLERFKRYPILAKSQRQQGTALIRFTMHRDGTVVSVTLDRSSGFDLLDTEAVALIRRAEPFPAVPADYPGDPIELIEPVDFHLKPDW